MNEVVFFLIVDSSKLELIPLPNAITLPLRGKKVTKVTLRELEKEAQIQ